MQRKKSEHSSRRDFLQDSAKATAGLAIGVHMNHSIDLSAAELSEIRKTRSYNPDMEYRRLGKTGLWISAIGLGGHWKRVEQIIGDKANVYGAATTGAEKKVLEAFHQNRYDVVSRCIEVGINLVDFAGSREPDVYLRALKGRREKMYLAWEESNRDPDHRTAKQLIETFEKHLLVTGAEYADIWRIMTLERGGRHTKKDEEEMVKAFEIAKQKGLCRFTGFSTHDRKWARKMIRTYPDVIEVVLFPYTADSKELPKDSFFDALKQYDVGVLGIKPFSSASLFAGDGSPDGPHVQEDNKRARMAVRYVLNNPAITAPIPGLASVEQVDNMVQAIKEMRDVGTIQDAELAPVAKQMWANLPEKYQWLKDWEYV